jgi:hypothetical protein
MTRLAAIFVTLAASLVIPAAAAAVTHTENARLGQVSARLTYDESPAGEFGNLRLTIFRGAAALLDYQVPGPCSGPCSALPGGGGQRRSIDVRELNGDSEPEVILDVNTGGAHCCDWAYVYSYVAAQNRYALTQRDFGDPGYRLVKLGDGRPVGFLGFDYRFAYAFTDYADSEFPPQLFRFARGDFIDETRSHPSSIRANARRLLREYRRQRGRRDVRGVLAAYAADQYLLGRGAAGLRTVRRALRRRDVRRLEFSGWPRGGSYLRALRKQLRAWGYIR